MRPWASGGVLHKRKQNPLHFQSVTIHGRGYLLNSCWDMGQAEQDVTITIGQKNEKGVHKITYAYGGEAKTWTAASIPPGSFVVYGRERDGAFTFWWKDKGDGKSVDLGGRRII